MKKNILRSDQRGKAEHGWLSTRFSFSFAEYYNPTRMHFGVLRVLNDDSIQAGMGFGMHPHDNMEIITIPLTGALEHRDSMGNGSIIRAGEIQWMSAGSGVRHSEFNPSETEECTLLQIWIFPRERNLSPAYNQKSFDTNDFQNQFKAVASPDGANNSIAIRQDAWLHLGRFEKGQKLIYPIKRNENGMHIFVIEGQVTVAGETLQRRDTVEIWETDAVEIEIHEEAYILLMDVPMQ